MHVLELGFADHSQRAQLPEGVEWAFEPKLAAGDSEYDICFVGRALTGDEASYLMRHVRAHCLFVLDGASHDPSMQLLMKSRLGRRIQEADMERFLEQELQNFYGKPYGEKFDPHMLSVSPFFSGTVSWQGSFGATLQGSFGKTMQQAAFWRGNIPVEEGQAIDFWLEYEKSGQVEIELEIMQFPAGSVSHIENVWKFSEEDLRDVVTIDNRKLAGPVFVSLNAKGEGTLKISALHDRHSRRGQGAFLPGGKRWVTSRREELFTYFDPGDLKPPLAVYFSGYKTMEGFEGYRMMRRMGCPFLLVADPRLEGGDFYLGDSEYEGQVVSAIQEALGYLGFTADQALFSGLSMGTFGALYYATELPCRDVVVGKPLLSLGNVAANERLSRPGGFPTSLDMLLKECGSLDDAAVAELNRKFWDRFGGADWSGRSIYAAYMIEDDYDGDAYRNLLEAVRGNGAKVVGKGLHGRHNDDTHGIVLWFIGQMRRVLKEYGRDQDTDGTTR